MADASSPSDSLDSPAPAHGQAADGVDAAPRWQRILGTAGGMVLGAVLVGALYGKILDPMGFVDLVAAEGLDFLLPAAWVAAIGLGLEAVLGFALLFNLRHMRVLIPSVGLVAFFVFLTSRTYYAHLTGQHEDTGSCGCFGNILDRTPAEAFWQDLLLLVPPMVLAFLGRPADPMPWQKLRWGATWVLSGLALGFAWLAPDLPIDDIATRLYPEAKASGMCAGRDDTKVCMSDVIPEISEGKHVVVLVALDDEDFRARLEAFNEYELNAQGPRLWVLTAAPEEDLNVFTMTQQPAFALVLSPAGVLRPLYRRLPRSFIAKDGVVLETIDGWPDLTALAADVQEEDDGAFDFMDDGPPKDGPPKDGAPEDAPPKDAPPKDDGAGGDDPDKGR